MMRCGGRIRNMILLGQTLSRLLGALTQIALASTCALRMVQLVYSDSNDRGHKTIHPFLPVGQVWASCGYLSFNLFSSMN